MRRVRRRRPLAAHQGDHREHRGMPPLRLRQHHRMRGEGVAGMAEKPPHHHRTAPHQQHRRHHQLCHDGIRPAPPHLRRRHGRRSPHRRQATARRNEIRHPRRRGAHPRPLRPRHVQRRGTDVHRRRLRRQGQWHLRDHPRRGARERTLPPHMDSQERTAPRTEHRLLLPLRERRRPQRHHLRPQAGCHPMQATGWWQDLHGDLRQLPQPGARQHRGTEIRLRQRAHRQGHPRGDGEEHRGKPGDDHREGDRRGHHPTCAGIPCRRAASLRRGGGHPSSSRAKKTRSTRCTTSWQSNSWAAASTRS